MTQNSCFKQILRDPTKPNGKGNYWTVVVDEIPGEMYKRQNTSVAYQAPEGKTYVSDLRDVYDFHFGQSKVVKNSSEGNLMALFETTILQNIETSTSISSPEIGGITGPVTGYPAGIGGPMTSSPPNGSGLGHHQQFHPPPFNPHSRNLQHLVNPNAHHNNQFNLFESQNPYGMHAAIHYGMMQTHQQHYNPLNPSSAALYHCHNFGSNTFNDIRNHFNPQIATHHNQSTSNSLPHSPSTASSPHSSLNLDMDFSFDKSNHTKSTNQSPILQPEKSTPNSPPETPKSSPIRSEPEPAAVMEYLPQSTKAQLKRKRTGSELELAEAMRKIKKSRIELQKIEKKSNFHNLRNLDSQPAPNQTVTISESDPAGPFAKARFATTTPPKPSPPLPTPPPMPGHMKHSIRNILNLDELDNDTPPPTLDPEQNPAQLKNSDVFVKGQISQKGTHMTQKGHMTQLTHRQYFNPFNPSSAIHYHLPKF